MLRAWICVILLGVTAAAQTASSKQAKIERLLELTNVQSSIDLMLNQMKTVATAQMPPGATGDRAATERLINRFVEISRKHMNWEKMRPVYVKLYEETFTEDEVAGMITFYETPVGRALITKMPGLMQKSMQIGQNTMLSAVPEIQQAIAEEMKRIEKEKGDQK